MIKLLLVSLLYIASLGARENPFFPSENNTLLSGNQVAVAEPLKRVAITLPSTARTVESITLSYKNLDGSIQKQTLMLDNSVDWHLPIFVSQNITGNEKSNQVKKSTKRKETFTKPKETFTKPKETFTKPKETFTKPKETFTKPKETLTEVVSLPYITMYSNRSKIKIKTKDKKTRDFLLTKPNRIICDFKRDTNVKNYDKSINTNSAMKQVKIGSHKGFYRVVIRLDGKYKYKISPTKTGYAISLL